MQRKLSGIMATHREDNNVPGVDLDNQGKVA
jgi:hypothetical protein